MFAHVFQTGSVGIEVISASGKEPPTKLLKPGTVPKVYERTVKGYIFTLDKSATSCVLQCPVSSSTVSSNPRDVLGLGLIQPYLVVQAFPFMDKNFHVEIVAIDLQNQRRRLLLSTSVQKPSSNSLHCQLPLSVPRREEWINLVFDLRELVSQCFRGSVFSALESFSIRPFCHIRKVFTLPSLIDDSPIARAAPTLYIPHTFNFPLGVPHYIHLIRGFETPGACCLTNILFLFLFLLFVIRCGYISSRSPWRPL